MSQAEAANITNPSDLALTKKGERYAKEHANREYFRKLHRLRKEAEAEVDRLLAFLDDLGGDPELEDGADDEPDVDGEASLGWTSTIRQEGRNWQGEHDSFGFIDAELDKADLEPSLSQPACLPIRTITFREHHRDSTGSQELWGRGRTDDREDDGDEEADDRDLPCAWPEIIDQSNFARHCRPEVLPADAADPN